MPAATDLDRFQAHASPAGLAFSTSAHAALDGAVRHRWVPYAHLRLLNDRILAAVSGELAREGKTGLIVSMPPRHGKSELTSRTLPAWYLGRYPDRKVILAGYQAQFAATWGRKARDLLEEHGRDIFGVRVSQSSSAADHWEIEGHDGAMHTAGVGGPITGYGADLLLIDDPIKNQEDARSEVMREKQWDWWTSTARTRLHAGGVAIIVATRWHEDDLIGRLLAQAETDPDADQWEVVNLPAIAEDDDPIGRAVGDTLCGELGYDAPWAKRTKASVGNYVWSALYQGKPRPAEGLLFKQRDFRYFTVDRDAGLYVLERYAPDGVERHPVAIDACTHFQTADVAASEKETADYTVVSTWAVTPVDRELLLVDRGRQRFELLNVGGFLESAYHEHKPSFLGVESFGHGLGVVQALKRKGVPIRELTPDKDKVARALVAVARYESHDVFHPRGPGYGWVKSEWEPELLAFPNGANDDQVDTCAYAARELSKLQLGGYKQKDKGRTVTGGLRSKPL